MDEGKEVRQVFFSFSGYAPLEDMKKAYILHVLKINNNNKKKTAEMLGIPLSTLYQKLK